jgi:hypothetical protein
MTEMDNVRSVVESASLKKQTTKWLIINAGGVAPKFPIGSQDPGFGGCKLDLFKGLDYRMIGTHYVARECSCILEIKWGIE